MINNPQKDMRLYIYIVIALCSISLVSCHTSNIDPDKMIGKTRNEVLPILFKDALREQYCNQPFIILQSTDAKKTEVLILYTTIEDVTSNKKIMTHPNWGFRKRIYDIVPITMFMIPSEIRCFLYFENEKVVRYEYSYFYE
jgi:hypothetical protein